MYRSETEHIYLLPFRPDTRWTHYKVALHSVAGHAQRIPFIEFGEYNEGDAASGEPPGASVRLLEHVTEPNVDWKALCCFQQQGMLMRIAIPSTVYSDACSAMILLRGYHV